MSAVTRAERARAAAGRRPRSTSRSTAGRAGARRRDDPRGRATRRRRDPATVLDAGAGPGRQLPRLRRRGARASGCWPRRAAAGRPPAWRCSTDSDARARRAAHGAGTAAVRPARGGARARRRGRRLGGQARRRRAALRARARRSRADLSHPAIAVNLDACIQCTRCVRACRDEQGNDVIGLAFRGEHARIVFDIDDAMGASTCVACGECVQACPTGALAPARARRCVGARPQVDTLCPYCGVGCQVTLHVKDDRILRVEGRDGPANHGRLCVKGRYGLDYARHPQRLTVPLIRRADAPKHADAVADPATAMAVLPRGELGRGAGAGRRRAAPHCATPTARGRWPASARPRAATKRPTCSRSWCGWASAATTSTTARGCAMRPASRRCSRAWARAPSATR